MKFLRLDDAEAILDAYRHRVEVQMLRDLAPLLLKLARRGPWDAEAQRVWTEAVDRELEAAEREFHAAIAAASGGRA